MKDVKCTWNLVPGADGYNVYFKQGAGNYVKQNDDPITDTEFIITDVADDTYRGYATSIKGLDESVASNVKLFVVSSGVPSAPTINSITGGDTEATVEGTLGSDGGASITDIEYQLNDGAWTSAGTTTFPFTITGLTNEQEYAIVTRAVNSEGASNESNEVTVTPGVAPDAPTIDSVTAGDTQLTVNGTLAGTGGTPTDLEYELDASGTWVSAGVDDFPFVISGLTNDQTYAVRTRALNSFGTSAASNSVNGTPSDAAGTVPDAPTIDSINSGNGEFFVYYTLGSNGGSAITALQYRLDGGAWSSDQAVSEPLVITAANENTYDTEIRAINAIGPSDASNTVLGKTEEQVNLEKYFAIDTDLISEKQNLTFETVELGNQVVLHSMNKTDDTPDESWERLDAGTYSNPKAAWVPGIPGTFIKDGSGNLKCYYELIFPHDGGIKRGMALQESTDGGSTWNKVRDNLAPGTVDDPDSNLIDFKAPSGYTIDDLGVARFFYDSNAGDYKALSYWLGEASYWVSTSADGKTWTVPERVLENIPGDHHPASFFYDENNSEWVIYFRGRGRDGSSAPSGGPPKPYQHTRFVAMATSSTYNGTYTIEESGGDIEMIVDPAIIYNYGSEADDGNWYEQDDGSCGKRWVPLNFTPDIRTDFQTANVVHYAGQYFMIPSSYFRDDDRSPYNSRDRTDGPTYPVWGHSRFQEGIAEDAHGGSVEGGWKFPDKNRSAVDLTPYLRSDGNSCNLSGGDSEVGRVSSSYGIQVANNRIISVVTANNHLEEQRNYGTNTDVKESIVTASHYTDQDRFAKLTAGGTEGYWRTSKVLVPDGTTSLKINSDGNVKVELLNVITNDPITGFTKSDAVEITTDSISNTATWDSNSIDELVGQNVRLKIYVTNGNLYSFNFE